MHYANLKTTIWTIVLILFASVAFGQIPQTVNYQGYLVDVVGDPVNGTVSMEFFIYDSPGAGTLYWNEDHPTVNVVDGGFTVILGYDNPLGSDVFGLTDRWLEVAVDGQPMVPRTKFTSMPYAQRVGTLDGAVGGSVVGTFEVVPSSKDGIYKETKHGGTPLVEIGTNFIINTAGLSGSLHLLDATSTPVIDLDGQSASIGINTTSLDANLHVNGDIYTLGGLGDANSDGLVNMIDLTVYINYLYFSGTMTTAGYANADIDGDGRVTSDDLSMVNRILFMGDTKAQAMQHVHGSYGASPDATAPDGLYVRGKLAVGTQIPLDKVHIEWVTGVDATVGRGTNNTNITFLSLRNANGTKCYIYPDPTGNVLIVSTTKP